MSDIEPNEDSIKSIGKIGNYYGGLRVCICDEKHYWSIENWDGDNWEEISEQLYDLLISEQLCKGLF